MISKTGYNFISSYCKFEDYFTLNKNILFNISEYINFKDKKPCVKEELNYKKFYINELKIKCINWFEYPVFDNLHFIVLKARNIDNNNVLYFLFIKYNYLIITTKDAENKFFKDLFTLVKCKFLDINIEYFNKYKKIKVNHYKNISNFAEYFIDKKTGLSQEFDDFILLKTNQIISSQLSSCENSFKHWRFFYLLNNINPTGSYLIKDIHIEQNLQNENIFFVENPVILFQNIIEIQNSIEEHYLSFDIESEVNPEYSIDSPKNILTQIGIEFYITGDQIKDSWNVCLNNIDICYRQKLQIDNPDLKIKKNILYEIYVKNKKINNIDKLIQIVNNNLLQNEHVYILENLNTNFLDIINYVKNNKFKYIFCKEEIMIEFFINCLSYLDIDYVLTYNGNIYDFPQLERRYEFITNKKFNIKTIFNKNIDMNFQKISRMEFQVTNISFNAGFIPIDIFNYVKKLNKNLSSFQLKDVSRYYFNIKAIIIEKELNQNIYYILPKEEDLEKLTTFFKVFLTSSYIYINDQVYKIINKKKYPIYETDIQSLINQEIQISPIKINQNPILNTIITISLSKDDVEISSKDIFEKLSMFEIANYCLHDAILCRYLLEKLLIKFDLDAFSCIFLLPQDKSFHFRNSTNSLGEFLRSCFQNKSIFIKTNKITQNEWSGGKVLEPEEHFIQEPVAIFDFQSLYPTIMIQYNISPDTLIKVYELKCEMEFDIIRNLIKKDYNSDEYSIICKKDKSKNIYNVMIFDKKKPSIISHVLKKFMKERKEYKEKALMWKNKSLYLSNHYNKLQLIVKELMNSIYGFFGSKFSILSCQFSSQAITTTGAICIDFLKHYLDNSILLGNTIEIKSDIEYNPILNKIINLNIFKIDYPYDYKLRLKIIYGDTDSIMIVFKGINSHPNVHRLNYEKDVLSLTSTVGQNLNNFINTIILESKLVLEFENILLDMILIAKKKYRGFKVEPFKFHKTIENKGISLKRRDCCNYQKRKMSEFFDLLHEEIRLNRFEETVNLNNLINSIWSFINKIIYEFHLMYFNNDINIEDFAITCYFRNNYLNPDYHIINLINEYNKTSKEQITKGDRFKFIFCKEEYNEEILNKFELLEDKSLKNLLKLTKWNLSLLQINNYKVIYDEIFDFNNKRLYFEIYLNKIINDICTIFSDQKNNIKKELTKNLKSKFNFTS